MARLIYPIKPVQHALSTESPALFVTPGFSPWVSNGRIEQGSFKKRPGYSTDRSLPSAVYGIDIFQTTSGSRYTMYLTGTDLMTRESGGTWSYKTDTTTIGGVSNISGAVVTGSGTAWNTAAANGDKYLAAGDKFILDIDHSSTAEPDSNWATIQSVDSDTQLTLTASYTGTTGAFAPAKAYKGRKVYSVPADERWSWAVVGDKFCFTNGGIFTQYWGASGYAADLAYASAVKARYCIEYANRLFLGDVYVGGNRAPTTIMWSKENDPTDWTDSTAGSLALLETADYITGLGNVGPSLVIYQRDHYYVYSRTGIATNPISRTTEGRGIGCMAPYGVIEFMGTNAWISKDDFYIMSGDQAVSIGGPVRNKFFSIVGETELKRVFGGHVADLAEVMWVSETTEGKLAFVYNYRYKEWYTYSFANEISAIGRGAV